MILLSELGTIQTIQARLSTGDIAASDRLDAATLAYLEHPADSAARERFRRFLTVAANTGSIPAERETSPPHAQNPFRQVTHWISRSDYRRWREKCPPSLLSEMTLIDRWWAPAKQSRNPVGKPPDRKRERQDALSVAIQTAIDALPGPPTLNAVFDYLATNDATKTIVGVSPDGGLVWVGYNGSNGKLYRAALEKRLARKQTR